MEQAPSTRTTALINKPMPSNAEHGSDRWSVRSLPTVMAVLYTRDTNHHHFSKEDKQGDNLGDVHSPDHVFPDRQTPNQINDWDAIRGSAINTKRNVDSCQAPTMIKTNKMINRSDDSQHIPAQTDQFAYSAGFQQTAGDRGRSHH